MNGAEPLSVKAARRWATVYTRGLPTDARERRCLELESDLWEQLHDADEPDAANAVLAVNAAPNSMRNAAIPVRYFMSFIIINWHIYHIKGNG